MRYLIIFLFNLIGIVYGQNTVSGYVYDAESHLPIEAVTVYINGSTRGTATDLQGYFSLKQIPATGELVIRHLNYILKTVNFRQAKEGQLLIYLNREVIQLKQIEVAGKSKRKLFVDEFKKYFLGTDYWGKHAKLLNDSVLRFDRQRDTTGNIHRISQPKRRSQNFDDNDPLGDSLFILKVSAKEPLLVDLPLLGYRLSIDLVRFTLDKNINNTASFVLGYFYFMPDTISSIRKQAEYLHNRRKAYYNSELHFTRALFRNQLREEGYIVLQQVVDSIGAKKRLSFSNIGQLLNRQGNTACVENQLNQSVQIYYVSKNDRSPIDMTKQKKFQFDSIKSFLDYYSEYDLDAISYLIFKSNTCKINSTGSVSNSDMVFGGSIGAKKIGAILPEDYTPK